MIYRLKQLIKSKPKLYTLWFYLHRVHIGVGPEYFNNDTAIYVDGFQRSGNTYLVYLVEKCFPEIHLVHHLHAIAPLKIALHKSIPTFIIIRNPLDVISSSYLRNYSRGRLPSTFNNNLIKSLIHEYYNYYKFTQTVSSKLVFLKFDQFISEPEIALELIANEIKFELTNYQIKDTIKKYSPLFRGATDLLGASLPNRDREAKKDEIKVFLRNFSEYEKVGKIYQQIINSI